MQEDKLKNIIESFKKLGLTEYEAKAYFFLMVYNALPADELCRVSGISPSRIYDVLSSLEHAGLITNLPGKPKKYQVISPTISLQTLMLKKEEEMSKEIKNIRDSGELILKHLQSVVGSGKVPEKDMFIGIIEGRAGLTRFLHGLFRQTRKELLCFAGDMVWLENELNTFEELRKHGVSIKIFGDLTNKNKKIVEKAKTHGIEIKQRPNGTGLRGFISDGKILYISRKYKKSGFEKLAKLGIKTPNLIEDYSALISYFNPLVIALRTYFYFLWGD